MPDIRWWEVSGQDAESTDTAPTYIVVQPDVPFDSFLGAVSPPVHAADLPHDLPPLVRSRKRHGRGRHAL